MFTGIIEEKGIIRDISFSGTNRTFWIESNISAALSIDQSVSHNGVCLTIEGIQQNLHQVTAIEETINKTNLGKWVIGDIINLERCMLMNGRIDGHMVQGHVDTTAMCIERIDKKGSWEFTFEIHASFAGLIIEKGSIALNGISLTIFNITNTTFTVAIIPYTFENTNMQQIKVNDLVNIEFDIIGKYIQRFKQIH